MIEQMEQENRLSKYINSRLEYFIQHPLTVEEFYQCPIFKTTKQISVASLYKYLVYKCAKVEADLEIYFLREDYQNIQYIREFLEIENNRLLTFANKFLSESDYNSFTSDTQNYIYNYLDSFRNIDIY
jgi:hypothetical protein